MAVEQRIGIVIRRARERKRWTQRDLAEAVGVSRATVDAWENDRTFPRNRAGALEEVLGISLTGEPGRGDAGPGRPDGLVPEDDWEADVLSDDRLPVHIREKIVLAAREVRGAYGEAPPGPPEAAGPRHGQHEAAG